MVKSWMDRFNTEIRDKIDWIRYYRASDFERAKVYCEELIETGNQTHDLALLGFSYFNMAEYYYMQQAMSEALQFGEISYEYLKDSDAPRMVANCCNLLGCIYFNSLSFEAALDYFMKGIEVSTKYQFYFNLGIFYSNIGSMYVELHDYEKSIYFFEKSVISFKDEEEIPEVQYFSLAATLMCIANCYLELDMPEQAKTAIDQVDVYRTLSPRIAAINIYYSIVSFLYYVKTGDETQAKRHFTYIQEHQNAEALAGDNLHPFVGFLEFLYENRRFEELKQFREGIEYICSSGTPSIPKAHMLEMKWRMMKDRSTPEAVVLSEEIINCYKNEMNDERTTRRESINHLYTRLEEIMMSDYVVDYANKDPLTGLYNRRYFDKVFEEKKHSAILKNSSFAVGMIDMDYFKQYNDHYGHLAGDKVLKRLAHTFKEHCDQYMKIGRFGGDEFVLIIEQLKLDEVTQRIEDLTNDIKKLDIRHEYAVNTDRISCSIGVTYHASVDIKDEQSSMIAEADELLYEVKKTRKSSFIVREKAKK